MNLPNRAFASITPTRRLPSCTPARAAILTGMDQWNHGRLTMTRGDALEYPATLPGELANDLFGDCGHTKKQYIL